MILMDRQSYTLDCVNFTFTQAKRIMKFYHYFLKNVTRSANSKKVDVR